MSLKDKARSQFGAYTLAAATALSGASFAKAECQPEPDPLQELIEVEEVMEENFPAKKLGPRDIWLTDRVQLVEPLKSLPLETFYSEHEEYGGINQELLGKYYDEGNSGVIANNHDYERREYHATQGIFELKQRQTISSSQFDSLEDPYVNVVVTRSGDSRTDDILGKTALRVAQQVSSYFEDPNKIVDNVVVAWPNREGGPPGKEGNAAGDIYIYVNDHPVWEIKPEEFSRECILNAFKDLKFHLYDTFEHDYETMTYEQYVDAVRENGRDRLTLSSAGETSSSGGDDSAGGRNSQAPDGTALNM